MTTKITSKHILFLIVLVSIIAFVFWLQYNPVADLKANIPGLDNRPKITIDTSSTVIIGEKFTFIKTHSSQLTGKWPNFRGADYDNINKETIKLIDHFPISGPNIVWQKDLGEGHAAASIYNGKVYVLDYNEAKKTDVLKCIALETGEELWRRFYSVHIKRNHGISRTIPAVNDKYVVTIGPKGHVMCVDAVNGNLLWSIDLVKTYASEIPFWNTGQCPLIANDIAIIAPCGNALMIGIDCKTGKVLWETENPDKWKMSHSSIIPMTYNGKKTYVYAAIGGICGISAEGKNIGKIIWKTKEFLPNVLAPSPVIINFNSIFITAGYGAGSMLLKLEGDASSPSVKILQKYLPTKGIASEQQTPLFYNGFLFAVLPKDAGGLRNQFVCYNPNDCEKIIWASGKETRFGLGPYIIADNKFFILDDDGTLTIAQATIQNFKILSKTKIMDGQDAWGPIAIADGYLIMRDAKQMLCLNMKKK